MTPEDLAALREAVRSLEHPGFAARLTNMVGKPIELIGDALPTSARHEIATATSKALHTALKVALRTMPRTDHAGSRLLHTALATASGAAGGAFGLATLPVELPVSTIINVRSIAEIARSHGEDPSDPESALSCVQVFALGGRAGSADASESGYFPVRGMLAKSVTEAARFIAERRIIRRPSARPLHYTSVFALWSSAHPKVCGTGSATRRCIRRRFRELRVYRTFSRDGSRSFHRSQAGTSVRQGHCTG
jgi:EcsC protein family